MPENGRIKPVEENQNLPEINRLSVLAAMIMLAYAFTPFVKIPEQNLQLQLPGFLFEMHLDFGSIISILVAVLAAAGASWLVSSHPRAAQSEQSTLQHWILPALTAWVIGIPLDTLSVGAQWWAVFAFGGALLMLVFVAEYIVVDPSDTRQALATVGLTAVSFALFLTLTIALRASGMRLFLALPTMVLAILLVTVRTLYLHKGGQWTWAWPLGIAMFIGQIGLGLHYLPLTPLRFGLLLLGPAYALTSFAGGLETGRGWRRAMVEPALMLAAFWALAFIIG